MRVIDAGTSMIVPSMSSFRRSASGLAMVPHLAFRMARGSTGWRRTPGLWPGSNPTAQDVPEASCRRVGNVASAQKPADLAVLGHLRTADGAIAGRVVPHTAKLGKALPGH